MGKIELEFLIGCDQHHVLQPVIQIKFTCPELLIAVRMCQCNAFDDFKVLDQSLPVSFSKCQRAVVRHDTRVLAKGLPLSNNLQKLNI